MRLRNNSRGRGIFCENIPQRVQQEMIANIENVATDGGQAADPVIVDGFLSEFANLTIQIPPSVRKTVRERLVKRGFDPSIEQPLPQHKAIIVGELSSAADKYKAKRAHARAVAASKRSADKEAREVARNAALAKLGGLEDPPPVS